MEPLGPIYPVLQVRLVRPAVRVPAQFLAVVTRYQMEPQYLINQVVLWSLNSQFHNQCWVLHLH